MNVLLALQTSVSGTPGRTILPVPYLPYEWARWAYLAVLFIVPAIICLHAWVVIHNRRHGFPPLLVLRFWQWWHGAKTGKIGRRRG